MGGCRSRGDFSVELRAGAQFVRQHGSDLVHAVPLLLPGVACRPVEEDVILLDWAAEGEGRAGCGGEERITERPGFHPGDDQVVRQRIPAHQILRQPVDAAHSRQLIRAAAADRIYHRDSRRACAPPRLTALIPGPAVRPTSALPPARLRLTSALSSSLPSVTRCPNPRLA